MTQPLRPLEDTGKPRTGSNAGGRHQKYFLDEAGRRLLLARYDGKTETIDELSRWLEVPRWVIKRWGQELGLARQHEPRWTQQDLDYLEGHLRRSSLSDIAQKLGRTKTAVRLKAKRIGVNKCYQEGYTMRGLCLGLGCDHHKVEKWMAKGWIRGTRRHTERTQAQGGDIWYFSDAAIVRLIKHHPQEIDPRRADWLWLVDLLLGGLGALSIQYGEEGEGA